MTQRLWRQLMLTAVFATFAQAQGLDTTASKDDWEEVNFEFESAVLVDGFPSLLKLAELLKANPAYRVKLEGHGDDRGSDAINDKLAAERAKAVKEFLVKYGANPGQIDTQVHGKRRPRAGGRSPEARFMNRRVNLTVTDGQGRVVGSGGVGDAIRAMQGQPGQAGAGAGAGAGAARPADDQVLKRLDKLDEIANMLRDLKNENDALKKELDALKAAQAAAAAASQTALKDLPKPLSAQEVETITDKAVKDAMAKSRMPRFTLMGVNAGVDDAGHLTFSGKGRYFAPMNENFAFQGQGEYLYFRDRKEGQFDLGLVGRYRNFQSGLFGSFKNVQLSDMKAGGTLGQGALMVDYIFGRGKVGLFGTKAFLDNRVIARNAISRTLEIQTLLKAVDQIGAQTTLGLYKDVYMEGNLGYLKSFGAADRPGGTLRFVFPINNLWAFTLEGGMNETLLGRSNNGRVVAGVQFGNFIRPKEYRAMNHPVPVDVPRVRYELVTRRVRTGNDAPIADPGPDQLGIDPGQITLDGSGSTDPEGDPITFQWAQVAGPAVSIAGASTSKATITVAEGQNYAFRLTVTDDKGASSSARVNVTVSRAPRVRILRFIANPQQIRAGEQSSLSWNVESADEVTIEGIGPVNNSAGNTSVSPQQTTTYKLTAKNRLGEVSETVTVTVLQPAVRVLFFSASPMTVNSGESTTLTWQTENADSVDITGVGAVAQSGSQTVTPNGDTTYTITARNRFGSATAQVAVRVSRSTEAPRILRFTLAPGEIVRGEKALMAWQVENATEVSISGIGAVGLADSRDVSPENNTRYVLTARNAVGETQAEVSITVLPAVRILSFTASPATSPRPGAPVTLQWTTEGAGEVIIDGIGPVNANGSTTVNPGSDTTYTLRAFGRRGGQDVARANVRVLPGLGGGPIANAGPNIVTTNSEVRLDGSKSSHPEGLVIGFSWRAVGRQPQLILGGDTATPTVRFAPLAFGEYVFELTVTDAQGRFDRSTTKVFFGAY